MRGDYWKQKERNRKKERERERVSERERGKKGILFGITKKHFSKMGKKKDEKTKSIHTYTYKTYFSRGE